MIDPMVKCMLSNLDMQKAEELGALVAASGAYWVPSPGGGISDPYLLKHFDGTVPSQRKRFSAVVNAESTIVTVLGDGADRCGIDEEEFEHGVGTLLGTENGTISHEMVKEMPERIQKIWAAFRVVRSTLLNSDEFRQGYQRTVAEHGRSDK
ncbi:hypothetical protein [Variovorax sp. YR750]|uniref:hypothetical protein n=1 Tax=Variovorax sp. YR750 TaxID=1884384 RepID=UPI0015A58B95|nr:hypothetical protein [Variovorax sp. YR750]